MIASIIVPTYNESASLPVLIPRIFAAVFDVEVVVVDDDSRDGTADVARRLAEKYPVRVVERRGERGLSTAVLRGIQEARSDICVVMDADLSHPPEAIPKLIQAVQEGAQVAVGSRYVPGGDIDQWPLFRRLASRAGTVLARPLTPVNDPMAGYFCLNRKLIEGVALKPRGFKILLEILARTRAGRIAEIPIHFEDRAAGTSKFSGKERRDFLRQVGTLYLDLNAWPWRVLKFLVTGALGILPDVAVLNFAVRVLGASPRAGAVAGGFVAMTCNYAVNRIWTFRARQLPLIPSYLKYVAGALGGLLVKLGVMVALPHLPYNVSNLLGILAGTVFNYLASQFFAFRPGQTHSGVSEATAVPGTPRPS